MDIALNPTQPEPQSLTINDVPPGRVYRVGERLRQRLWPHEDMIIHDTKPGWGTHVAAFELNTGTLVMENPTDPIDELLPIAFTVSWSQS